MWLHSAGTAVELAKSLDDDEGATPIKPQALVSKKSFETPVKSGGKLSVEESTNLILSQMNKRKHGAETSGGDGTEHPKATAKGAKATASKGKASAACKGKGKPHSGGGKFNPTFCIEKSRKQVMCRTGLKGSGQNHAITFKSAGSEAKAIKLAKVWVADQVKKHG